MERHLFPSPTMFAVRESRTALHQIGIDRFSQATPLPFASRRAERYADMIRSLAVLLSRSAQSAGGEGREAAGPAAPLVAAWERCLRRTPRAARTTRVGGRNRTGRRPRPATVSANSPPSKPDEASVGE